MPVQVCSLIVKTSQTIPNDGRYHIVRFPFGSLESYDGYGMHQVGDIVDWRTDDRSGLIWPAVDGWGSLTGMLYWETSDATEFRDRFVRDPLNLSTGWDSTATEHRPPSPGMQCFHKSHEMFVKPETPLSLMVSHNASAPIRLTLAEFKLAIHT